MALYALASASGSPGVTTSAQGLADHWPGPVLLVEADPTGASAVFAGRFRGAYEPGTGLIDLAVAQAEGRLKAAFPAAITRLPDSEVRFLPGIRSNEQAPSLESLWPPLLGLLRSMGDSGQDVIVDAGRLGLAGWPRHLVEHADVAVLLTRNSLLALAGARSWAATLRTRFAEHGGTSRLGLLVVEEATRSTQPYPESQVAKALQLPVVASLPHDPDAAEVYSHGARPPRKFATSRLTRAYAAAGEAIRLVHARNDAELAGGQSRIAAAARSLANRSLSTQPASGGADV